MVYCDVEDVYSGGECVDFIFVFYFLQVDGSVFIIGYDDFVVRGNGNVLNLKKKERSFIIMYLYNFIIKFFFFIYYLIFMDFLEGFVRNVKVKYF